MRWRLRLGSCAPHSFRPGRRPGCGGEPAGTLGMRSTGDIQTLGLDVPRFYKAVSSQLNSSWVIAIDSFLARGIIQLCLTNIIRTPGIE